MLSRRDVENVFDRVSDCEVEWEFWHDTGNDNVWVGSDGEWLVQVSHRDNVVVFTHNERDSDKQVGVVVGYNDDRSGIKMLLAATVDPDRTHASLRANPATEVVAAEISIR